VIGRTISQYRIEEKLGQGGMGEVYRAADSKLRRDVALKVLPDTFAADPERMARFRREAQVLASLNHPNIGAIYGLEEVEGIHALVLELVRGPTLADRIGKGPLAIDEAMPIALQIARALESAHEQGIIHRDLKPENIKFTADGQVKVLDFGLAKALEGEPAAAANGQSPTLSPTISPAITGAMTAANVILGTAGYMSPEQARGQAVDRRADIWAFGVCLFEMLTGRRLFVGETVSDTLASVLKVDPDWSTLPARTPRRVKRLLRRCLERDPKSRLRDIGDARIAIEEVLAGGVEEEEETARVGGGTGTRHRALAGIGALVVAAAAFLAGYLLRPDAPEPPVRKFVLPVPDLTASLGSGTTVAISPDGSRIAYTSEERLWVRDLNHIEPRALPGTDGAVKPFWSPDGDWVAYGTASKLWKIRATGGDPVAICELNGAFNPAAGGVWLDSGDIVFCDGNGPLLTISSQGGDPDTLLPLDPENDDDFHNVSGLPDGRGFVFVVHTKDDTYDRIDLFADGERRKVLEHDGQAVSLPCYSPSGHLLYHREPLNRGIWAVPFSLDELRVTGKPFLAIPDGNLPNVASDGTLVHSVGARVHEIQLFLVDRTGQDRTAVGDARQFGAAPALSPDGRRVAVTLFGENDDIWILDSQRGTQTRLTFDPGSQHWPAWSPDGRRIYYSDGEGNATYRIHVKAADGTGAPDSLGRGSMPSVSRDGRFLFYSLFDLERSTWDIHYYELGEDGLPTGESKAFLATDETEYGARLSPDGRYVAYHSWESGQIEIYLKRFPGGEGKWQVTIDGGNWPRWSEDGSELYFMKDTDLYVVPVQAEPSLSLGTPRVLFPRSTDSRTMPFGWPDAFDVSPDGEGFLIAEPVRDRDEPGGPEGLVVTENWFAEFRGAE